MFRFLRCFTLFTLLFKEVCCRSPYYIIIMYALILTACGRVHDYTMTKCAKSFMISSWFLCLLFLSGKRVVCCSMLVMIILLLVYNLYPRILADVLRLCDYVWVHNNSRIAVSASQRTRDYEWESNENWKGGMRRKRDFKKEKRNVQHRGFASCHWLN